MTRFYRIIYKTRLGNCGNTTLMTKGDFHQRATQLKEEVNELQKNGFTVIDFFEFA